MRAAAASVSRALQDYFLPLCFSLSSLLLGLSTSYLLCRDIGVAFGQVSGLLNVFL